MLIKLAAPENRPSLPRWDASRASPHAEHEPLTMRQNGKRPHNFNVDEGLHPSKRSRKDVSDLLL